ncbi:MAG: glucan 1,4-alpha-glucosidase [Gemmataceae bacterium]|nr:glucan 1,4-alpha-glucosidase [Gemmataceae bacterium]
MQYAPGGPGIIPRWTSSAKTGVGTALNTASHVWFTLSHGIFDEIYYPRIDQACVRDMGLLVSNGKDFFSEEKRDTKSQVSFLEEGVPAYRLVNTCSQGRYRIEKEILSDPRRSVVLQQTKFVAMQGTLSDYALYVLLSPHLGNRGSGNTGWVGDFKGVPMLFAQRDAISLALACSVSWKNRSAGFSGVSDGWQDVNQHKRMTWNYDRAENGNVALTGEVDLQQTNGTVLFSLGFGRTGSEAGHRALASLLDGFDIARKHYIQGWREWQKELLPLETKDQGERDLYRISTAVLHMHEAKDFSGGSIASLSIPWGFAKTDDDLGGYHLVWPRDMVETAGGLLAAGALKDAHRMLRYLQITQEADGHWPQNMWLPGKPYWDGVQMDETAFPILLVDMARRHGALDAHEAPRFWPMVRSAAAFIVKNGPVTQEDRWEEDPGYSPFTLAAEIAALLAAADIADDNKEPAIATLLREAADTWHDHIDDWIYATGTDMAKAAGVEGYYVRVSPPDQADASSPAFGFVPIRNRPPGQSQALAAEIVSPDALALVRFGLRAAGDPRMVNTVKVIDKFLKLDTPQGPCWYRYNNDGYGEKADGSAFDGTGIGRLWPLLAGERAHYELAAGHRAEALRLLRAMEAFANDGKMLPEQVWDTKDIPEKELFLGRATGSAMPLVWAHSEYIKLRRSLRDGKLFDLPPQTVQRYIKDKKVSEFEIWSFNHKRRHMRVGKTLRMKVLAPALVHWSTDGGRTYHDTPTRDSTIGIHIADLPTKDLAKGSTVTFTFVWTSNNNREPEDFTIEVG